LATGIRGYKSWNREWNTAYAYRRMTDESIEFANGVVENVRLSVLENISELYEKTAKGKHLVKEYAKALFEFFERQQYYIKLMEFADEYEEKEDFDMASEYRQLYGMVIEVFEKLVSLMGDEEMTIKEFKDILDVGFSEARIGVIPPGIDQVMVGDLSRTRISNIKYMFLVGANSSNIPKGSGNGGIISESERNFLFENEFELAPTARQQVYTEQFYLYLNLTKPSRHLYITYCDSDRDGSVNEPSYIISRINKIFPSLNIKYEDRKKNEENAWSDDKGKKYLIAGLRNSDFSDEKWQEIYNCYFKSEKNKETLQKILRAAFFKENKSSISKEIAKRLYPENLRGSTSQLERYAACAFSYFMQYGLKLQERQEHSIEAYDIGNIVHDALDMYTKILLANNKRWQDIEKKEQERIAGECVEKAVSLCKDGIMRDTSRNQYMVKRIHHIVNKTIWAISKQMSQGNFDTIESELIFETVGKAKDTDEELIKLIGKIDRLDGFSDGSKDYVRVIDYKTGNKELSLSELYYGLQMQLVIYLKASIDKMSKGKKIVVPAGMLYYRIKDPILNERVTPENVEQKTLEALAMNGLVNGDSPMLEGSDLNLEQNDGLFQPDYVSSVSNIETGKKGQLKKSSGVTNTECLGELIEFTEKKVVDMSEEILDGNTLVNPYKTMDAQPKSACMYCAFKSVCRFDSRLYGNDYRVFEKLSDDDVMRLIHNELSENEDTDIEE
ncbi:PD-(D/E)XK nuclease family protein, partial [Butyribacter sp.]|uniref:PD-(D/E)XK nuclease family protein n=1 Tax=Butyribacter sp. TaxID=2822465 RepID=UPI002A969B19|nr:PD-(D/E)XK nuclease family protein [Butyribacter sp.]